MDGMAASPVRVTSRATEAASVVQTGSASGAGAAAIQGAISGQEQSSQKILFACREWPGTASGPVIMCAECEAIGQGG